MQSAAKVGLFVIGFVVLLFAAYAALGRTMFAAKEDVYYAVFSDVTGVTTTTPVLMAGVKVGSLTKIALEGPTTAKITFTVKEGTKIPEGSIATVPTPLIGLGEVPVTIVPPSTVAGNYAPGATLQGQKQGPLDAMLPDSKETLAELTKTIVAVRKLLEDEGLKSRADKLLATSEKSIDEFGKLASTTNRMLAQNQAAIATAIRSANIALQDVHEVTSHVAAMLEDGKLQGDARAIVAELRKTSESATKLMASVEGLVSDPELQSSIKNTTANVEKITQTGTEIAANTKAITDQGIEISKNAKVVSEKAIPLMDRASEVMTKATEIEDQLKGVIDRVGGFFTRRPGPGPLSGLTVSMDLMRETNPGYWRTDIGFALPIADGTVHAGLFDAFGSNKLTLQLGKEISPGFGYRYGIYAAKPGVGVDYRLAPRVTLRGDVWDINRLRVDLRARYDFGNGIVGWAGVDSLFDRNAATIGIGIRR